MRGPGLPAHKTDFEPMEGNQFQLTQSELALELVERASTAASFSR